MRTKKVFITFIIVSTVAAFIVGGFVLGKNSNLLNKSSDKARKNISSTSSPFYQITIPYLRSREYRSKLGELKEYSSGINYTSYITSYKSDGFKINGLLTKPEGTEPKGGWPAIVFIHGYIPPTTYETTGEAYSEYVDYLARNGFVVFKIDLRGNGSSEGAAGGGYYGSDYIVDSLNAYSALQNSGFVNPKKIGLWGHSMAGNVVMRSFAIKPEIPAVVIWAGAVYSYLDQAKYGIHDESYRPPTDSVRRNASRQKLFDAVGSPSAQSDFWRQVAPTNFLNDLRGAIEIHHAEDDPVVNIGYSRDLIAMLDKTSVPHKFYTYPSGGHNISGTSFDLAMTRTVEFFRKYLK